MKLIIDIPEHILDTIQADEMLNRVQLSILQIHILKGTPLDDVKEEIEQDMSFDMFDDYGNKTRIHKELWEILDNIGKESEGANEQ